MPNFRKSEHHIDHHSGRILSKEELDAKHQAALEAKAQVTWKSPERIFKARSKKYFTKVALYALIFVLAAIALLTGCLVGSWKLIALLLMLNGEAWVLVFSHAFLTALRVFVAIFLASLWTIPVGALIGFFPRLTRIAQPLVQVAAAFPTPMLFPLIVLALHWLGIGLGLGSTLLLMTAVQWYLLFNIIAGASSIPQNLKEVGQTYGLSKTAWIKKVIFPALFPFLVTGWTTAAGGAWNASIVAEYVHYKGGVFVTDGLGALMSQAAEQSNSAMLAASLVVMILAVVGLNKVCWKKLATVAEKKYSLGE